jgi:hypothetical protein
MHWTGNHPPGSWTRIQRCLRLNGVRMTELEYSRKLEELDQLLNDPTVPMQPDRIWSLLADVSGRDVPASGGNDGG